MPESKQCVALEKIFYNNRLVGEGEIFSLKPQDTRPPKAAVFVGDPEAEKTTTAPPKVFTAGKQSAPLDTTRKANAIAKEPGQVQPKVDPKDGAPKGTK